MNIINLKNKKIKNLLFIATLLISIYLTNKYEYSKGGLGNNMLNYLKLEFILILIISYTFLFYLKEKVASYIIVLITIVSFYFFFNEYYIIFNRPLKLFDYQDIPELISVSSIKKIVICLVCITLYFSFVIYHIDLKKIKQKYYVSIPLLLLFLSIYFTPTFYLSLYKNLNFSFDNVELKKCARENGFLNFILYEEALKNKVYNDLSHVKIVDKKDYRIDFMKHKNIRPNIHLIVLESFFDPNMFSNMVYSKDPIHPFFKKYYKNKNLSISPAYGGGTPLAEYEVLTNTKALRKYSSVEFNLFTGSSVNNALPNLLRKIGYQTIATNSLSPDTFNSFNAYKGLGFDEQYYLKSNKTYLKIGKNDRVLFDGDLFEQNLAFIKNKIKKKPNKPILNYVLGMYGHTPHSINSEKRPIVIKSHNTLTNAKDELFNRSVNQTYYRTKYLGIYIDSIFELDPKSIVLIIGDHLPKINKFKTKGYTDNDKQLIQYYLINNKKAIKLSNIISHYNISDLIIKTITGLNNTTHIDLDSEYDQTIKQAIQ
jgi:hypothetical protein